MANLSTILRQVRTEIAQSIIGVAPDRKVSSSCSRFVEYEAKKIGQPLDEQTGPTRAFEIGEPEFQANERTGADTETKTYHLPVTFLYQRGRIKKTARDNWSGVAMGDMDKLRHTFIIDPGGSGVTGCNMRFIDMDAPIERVQNPEDPVDYYTVIFYLNLDVSY